MEEKNLRQEITEEHLKLLKEMNVGWGDIEYGAPCIDPKRPYGNSDVEEDICRILGKKKVEVDYDERYLTKDLEYASKIHKEMKDVLQICLFFQEFKIGNFKRKESWYDWEKVANDTNNTSNKEK